MPAQNCARCPQPSVHNCQRCGDFLCLDCTRDRIEALCDDCTQAIDRESIQQNKRSARIRALLIALAVAAGSPTLAWLAALYYKAGPVARLVAPMGAFMLTLSLVYDTLAREFLHRDHASEQQAFRQRRDIESGGHNPETSPSETT